MRIAGTWPLSWRSAGTFGCNDKRFSQITRFYASEREVETVSMD